MKILGLPDQNKVVEVIRELGKGAKNAATFILLLKVLYGLLMKLGTELVAIDDDGDSRYVIKAENRESMLAFAKEVFGGLDSFNPDKFLEVLENDKFSKEFVEDAISVLKFCCRSIVTDPRGIVFDTIADEYLKSLKTVWALVEEPD